jgi:hypothetical protein
MTLQRLPKDINLITFQELQNFSDTFANFFFTDQSKLPDLGTKIADIVSLQTSIASEPLPYSTIIK